jgi:TetR/AcrR family transcriptional regulator of autoinduction and epiphytic fitness
VAQDEVSDVWLTEANLDADRRGRRRARRVRDILLTTAVVVGEKGFNNTSLDEIAERLDLAKASIYHYFDSKEALVLTMLTSCHEYVVGRLTEIADGDGDPVERLGGMIRTQISMTTKEIPELTGLFLHPMSWPDPLDKAVKGFREKHDDIFRKVIDDGVRSGHFRLAKPSVSRLCMQGALSFIPDWFNPTAPGDIELVVETLMAMFVIPDGAMPTPRRSRRRSRS